MTTVRQATGWVGWIGFAGMILILNGLFSAIQGLVAIIGTDLYYVVANGSLFLFDISGWGWWNLVFGVLLLITGLALLSGATWARVLAIILVSLSAIGQLLLLPAQPWWSVIVIAIDVLVIFAISMHGRELADER